MSVLACERVLADLDGRPTGWLDGPSRAVVAQVPQAARWARGFTRDIAISPKTFRRHSAPATVHAAVEGSRSRASPSPTRCSMTCSPAR